ncbi:protein broad-minded-like, partial [Diprion similis]|uniref:protein broad-minded-like n=1 Tax=Diprion similis TaxID=362088 RepID=UPI001EF8F1DB
ITFTSFFSCRAIKNILLKVVSLPLALQLLTREESVFEELLRGSVEPLKSSWSCNNVVAFLSTAALEPVGFAILRDLAPHFLSKVLSDVCAKLEDPQNFHDPWEDCVVKEFLHILRLLSLNILCFIALLDDTNQEISSSEDSHPSNLWELLQYSVNCNSAYHCLALMALHVFLDNLDADIFLKRMLNYQELLLNLQENCTIEIESDGELKVIYAIDEAGFLRHKVLLKSYCIINKFIGDTEVLEQAQLFSKLPPPVKFDMEKLCPTIPLHSELGRFLQESKPGLRDNGWVSQARKAHKISSKEPIQHSVVINLLDQMQKAVPELELTNHFEWPGHNDHDTLLPEEVYGIELTLLYAEQNQLMKVTPLAKTNLKIFLKEVHGFIKYYGWKKKFEGFDWFIASVFIICDGNMERCKTFITQIVQFPSIMYIWPMLGKAVSRKQNFPVNVQTTFSHLLENIVANELPSIKYALKNNCGTDWWIICDEMISQYFWRVLPWCEIVHLLAICILYPADYTLYYCTSLLHYSQNQLLEDVTDGKMWPEHMDLTDYRSGNHLQLMDLLSKRYRNITLPLLMYQEAALVT